jgi:hypothetical protein
MPTPRRLSFTIDSLHALADVLEELPHSKDRTAVLAGVHECREAVERWHQHPPETGEHERMMRRVLGLHVAATWLRRG